MKQTTLREMLWIISLWLLCILNVYVMISGGNIETNSLLGVLLYLPLIILLVCTVIYSMIWWLRVIIYIIMYFDTKDMKEYINKQIDNKILEAENIMKEIYQLKEERKKR